MLDASGDNMLKVVRGIPKKPIFTGLLMPSKQQICFVGLLYRSRSSDSREQDIGACVVARTKNSVKEALKGTLSDCQGP